MEKKQIDGDDDRRPWQSYNTVYTNAKAGMEGVDKEKVQRIVYEMSKGSKYFENEERKEAIIREKIEKMRARCMQLTATDLSQYQKVADKRILELESTRDLSRIWLHVDMDAFYAAVETLSNPLLEGKPMAVGSMSMISTANYEARKYGVRAAMPGFIARRLCPELIFVPTDFKKYNYYSDLARKVFRRYDSNFLAASLDEAYLDITEVCKDRGLTSEQIAMDLRTSIYEETGLTCSAGVAANRLLAKVCSDINKPNGQFILPNDRRAIVTFVSSLPIRKIGGIGKVTEHILKDALGINTCEEMLQKGGHLCALFSISSADFFLSVGLGLGSTDTPQVRLRKSISNERTFAATAEETLIFQKLADLAEMLSMDMEKEGLSGRTLTLKLKTASFEVRTRAVTLQQYICSSSDILQHASKLLKAELPISLRLIGLRISHFNEDGAIAGSDPAQTPITRFITSGDATRKNMGDCCTLNPDPNVHDFMDESEIDVFINGTETHHQDSSHPRIGNNLSNMDDRNCTSSNDAEKSEKFKNLSSNVSTDQVDNLNGFVPRISGTACASSPRNLEGNQNSNVEARTNVEARSPDNSGQNLWIDDYKCAICGAEVPESFIDERQEHMDFHIAEKLQEEESGIRSRTLTPIRRTPDKNQLTSQRKQKRQKSTPKKEVKHIPIDLFFVKNNQKF
ncbi:DNA polymerase kappa isoform X2 [Cucurbita maxima]|uniref:DNA polymerase kappa n=1 Tax=Cucurbita maxima TaxID=3661 RepID=A0A6J1I4S8_CUCMA|nr:DNA polymerase kappa isoform X2 [Cucurbita maxima]